MLDTKYAGLVAGVFFLGAEKTVRCDRNMAVLSPLEKVKISSDILRAIVDMDLMLEN